MPQVVLKRIDSTTGDVRVGGEVVISVEDQPDVAGHQAALRTTRDIADLARHGLGIGDGLSSPARQFRAQHLDLVITFGQENVLFPDVGIAPVETNWSDHG